MQQMRSQGYVVGDYGTGHTTTQTGLVANFIFTALTPTGPGRYPTFLGVSAGREFSDGEGGFVEAPGNGYLEISDLGPGTVTPKPETWVMVATGLVGGLGAVRRRWER